MADKSSLVFVVSPGQESYGLYIDGILFSKTLWRPNITDAICLLIKHQITPGTYSEREVDEDCFNSWADEFDFPKQLKDVKLISTL